MSDTSLRLRPLVSLVFFLSAYSPLMIILTIKDLNFSLPHFFGSATTSGILIFMAIGSSVVTLMTVRSVESGLTVVVTKAANKSGDMFGYTIPYMLSFMRVDLGDWQTLLSLVLFLSVLFIMAYRTQTVFINPVLAIAGYMLIDCTFKRDGKEVQAMVVTREPISAGDSMQLDQLSHYLYIRINTGHKNTEGHA
ncbi:TPA: hypothetical protein ACID8E_002185 [Pseudomonas aeruginosa]|uniref:hypothetical protein n=1 Tax=Azospira sp. I09 TaxID=1765049 RepID=UPI00156263D7|nr:hypothetical protein [Azospira sp. I09]MBN0116375.1 hypothetical protein [Pseudomonas aeruginosa]MBN0308726.1 hypothetical protein [Pseudomonas aeruginosa]MDP5933282.1 hypothetical protein [Pseudomonas aeruginosa]WJO56664.1 hypothetical protein JTL46_23940 [Pseudomonas aeruginosa]